MHGVHNSSSNSFQLDSTSNYTTKNKSCKPCLVAIAETGCRHWNTIHFWLSLGLGDRQLRHGTGFWATGPSTCIGIQDGLPHFSGITFKHVGPGYQQKATQRVGIRGNNPDFIPTVGSRMSVKPAPTTHKCFLFDQKTTKHKRHKQTQHETHQQETPDMLKHTRAGLPENQPEKGGRVVDIGWGLMLINFGGSQLKLIARFVLFASKISSTSRRLTVLDLMLMSWELRFRRISSGRGPWPGPAADATEKTPTLQLP